MTTEKKYHRKEIATEQLKTALMLFLNNKDLASVITLASAAGNILSQLVRNSGKEPFVEYARRVHEVLNGNTPSKEKFNHFIDKTLGIIPLKHMNNVDPLTVELDLEQNAVDALTKAISDYIQLYGQEEIFIKKFLSWRWKNTDNSQLIELYKNRPEKLKKHEKKRI